MSRSFLVLALLVALTGCGAATRPPSAALPPGPYSLVEVATGRPDAVVDLADDASAALVSARWRHAPVSLLEVDGVDPGPDARPVPSSSSRTHDLSLAPRREGWDAAAWEPFEPHDLGARRGHGHLSMGWVRVEIVLPERIGDLDVRGTAIAFEMTADDYGEVWVNGRLPHRVGDRGGHVVAGWNAPNRVVLTTSAEPGMRFDIAVLLVNGPISRSPGNFYWVRQAMLDVYRSDEPVDGLTAVLRVDEAEPGSEALAPNDVRVERIATGFVGLGPVLFVPEESSLLASDVEGHVLYRFAPETGGLSVVQTHVSLTAMGLDREGRMLARRADGQAIRYERSGAITELDGAVPAIEPATARARLGPDAVRGMARGADGLYVATANDLYRLRTAADVGAVSVPGQTPEPPPVADRDADGVIDDVDACPDQRGQASERAPEHGCPHLVCLDCGVYRPRVAPISFAQRSASLQGDHELILAEVAELLLRHPELRTVEIQGYADDREGPDAERLADARAAVVLEWLAAHGVVRERLRLASGVVEHAPEGPASVARVELRIVDE